jgi:hypothetical protein
MTDAALKAVLRRDRAIVTAALFVLAALAWAYVLWLAADMDMGGMDMSGFRMIPAGTVLMMPTTVPWNATEFAFVSCNVGGNDGQHDDAIGDAHDPNLCARGAPGGATGKAIRRELLVCKRLSSSLDRLCSCCDVRAKADLSAFIGSVRFVPIPDVWRPVERRMKPSLLKGSPFSIVSAQFPNLRANRCQRKHPRQRLVPAFENLRR